MFLKDRYKEYDPSKLSSEFPLKLKGNHYPTTIHHYNSC